MDYGFLSQLLTNLLSTGIVGFLFWAWLKSNLKFLEKQISENRARIIDLEKRQNVYVEKNTHDSIRKEDKEGVERQLAEMRKDIKEMPGKILEILKPFIEK